MRIGGWQQAADGRPGVAPWSLWMDLSGDAELVLSSTSLLLAGFSGRCRNCTSPLPAISSAIACCETRICSSDGIVCVCVSVARRTSPFTKLKDLFYLSDALDEVCWFAADLFMRRGERNAPPPRLPWPQMRPERVLSNMRKRELYCRWSCR